MSKKDSQEGNTTLEQQDEKSFIEEFTRISSVDIFKEYEKKNRDRINEASLIVKDSFDKRWKKVLGNNYYQPITTVQTTLPAYGKNNTERSDPRSRDYRSNVLFKEILWQKVRRRIRRQFMNLYTLQGITADTNTKRPIFQNLTADRLKEILGVETAEDLLAIDKKIEHGSIKGEFDLKVEGFWEVLFSPAKDSNDPINVRLAWEGQCLIMKRMTEVVIPGFYLEVADHSTRDQYTQNAKDGRKKIGVIQEYPYTVLREATMEEYIIQKSEGDKIMRDVRAKNEG